MKSLIYIPLLLLSFNSSSQDYIEYQRTINRVDKDVIDSNLYSASVRLDSIYNNYSFIYARHCIKALQINCVLNDTQRMNQWLIKCFTQGVPKWVIRNNELTKKVFLISATQKTLIQYDSLRSIYVASLNLKVKNTIDSLYTLDQRRTKKVNDGFIIFRHTIYGLQWLNNNKRQAKMIKKITKAYGFPGERLIGLPSYFDDSATAYKTITRIGPDVNDYRAYIMLIHYFSNPRQDMNELLLPQVKLGYMCSYQYASINDFLARWGYKKYRNNFYNQWHSDPDKNNIELINNKRLDIGLTDLSFVEMTNELQKKRRIEHKNNSSILLE
ncbi:MAG: hypothetical protein HYZ42_10675 [Bacteroidetes bacterium]|nr:hypothetical protein [Bacteroidota bacterium]